MTSSPKDWRLFADPSDTGSTEQQTSDVRKASGILESDSPETLIIIVAQLQAVAHQKASTISRNVMIDLEKRLGRKTRCQGFETFLVGILLLSCVERMCWAIKSVSLALQDGDVSQRNLPRLLPGVPLTMPLFVVAARAPRGLLPRSSRAVHRFPLEAVPNARHPLARPPASRRRRNPACTPYGLAAGRAVAERIAVDE